MKPVSPVLVSLEAMEASVAKGPHFREVVYGANQPEYLPLPALVGPDPQCETLTRWRLSWKERLKVLIGGNVWLSQWTFGHALQPVRLSVHEPLTKADIESALEQEPITAKDGGEDDDAVACRGSLEGAPVIAGNEIMFMPAGVHTITPSQGGKVIALQVLADRAGAAALEAQRAALLAKGARPYFDFNHSDGEASFWPEEFIWRESPAPGIYARGEWSGVGRQAVEAKAWRQFSPVFHVDSIRNKPARIVCHAGAKPNMGGLVNDPAFKTILPIWAKDAGAPSADQNPNTTDMTKEERARLQSTIQGLQTEIATLKGDASKATELRAKEADLRAAQAEIRAADAEAETAAVKAKNTDLQTADENRRKAEAQAFVKGMVDRGAIAAKDADALAAVEKNMTENPEAFRSVYEKWPDNPALAAKDRATTSTPNVVVNGASPKEALQAFAAIVAKNSAIRDVASQDKSLLAIEAANFYQNELAENEGAWLNMPLKEAVKAADASEAAIGTLAGTIVLQRNLPLFLQKYPLINSVANDFSAEPGEFNGTAKTRIIIRPAVQTFDATLDSNGRPKGFVVVKPAQTVDVPITLDTYVGVPMIFGNTTLASTVRNLFGEQSEAALNALAGYFVDKITGLMTAANFNAYKGTSVTGGETTDGSTTIVVGSSANLYPGQAITGTGIPTNCHIASVTDSTHAVLTLPATATNTGLTFTVGDGKVPVPYATYAKAKADFSTASLDDIGEAFDTNDVPMEDRNVLLVSGYWNRLRQDPALNMFFAAQQMPSIVTKGELPDLSGFLPRKAPWFPTANNGVGFAFHKAALAVKSRLPQDFTQAVGAPPPGTVTTITDPATGLSVLLVQRVDLVGNYAESRIEVMLGANVGDRRGGLLLTSQ